MPGVYSVPILNIFRILLLIIFLHAVHGQTKLPPADENLNIYVLPVGHGDATIIQCPTGGLTILNMGSLNTKSYWDENDIEQFIGDVSKVEQIIISRPHLSMYNLLPKVIRNIDNIKHVYITCRKANYMKTKKVRDWLGALDTLGKVVEIKSNRTGYPKCDGLDCTQIKVCSDSSYLETNIIAANLGNCADNEVETRTDSLVLQVKFYDFAMLLPGDIQDPTDEDNFYLQHVLSNMRDRKDIQSTVMKAAGHGDWGRSNKLFFLDAVKPQYIVIGNAVPEPDKVKSLAFTPRCELMDYLANRQGGTVLTLATVQPFQCHWDDDTTSKLRETNRAVFLTAYDSEAWKVRRVIKISSDGEKHKVTPILSPAG